MLDAKRPHLTLAWHAPLLVANCNCAAFNKLMICVLHTYPRCQTEHFCLSVFTYNVHAHCMQSHVVSTACIVALPHRFDRNIAAYVTMPRRKRRAEKRDSGFHSEVSSVATISSYCSGYCPIVSYLCITTHNILPLDQRILANRKETK